MARTGENIYKRKDGRWEARYISSYNADGKAKYKYLYARTYTEVKTKLIRAQNSVETKVEAEKIRDKEKFIFLFINFGYWNGCIQKEWVLKNQLIFGTEM